MTVLPPFFGNYTPSPPENPALSLHQVNKKAGNFPRRCDQNERLLYGDIARDIYLRFCPIYTYGKPEVLSGLHRFSFGGRTCFFMDYYKEDRKKTDR